MSGNRPEANGERTVEDENKLATYACMRNGVRPPKRNCCWRRRAYHLKDRLSVGSHDELIMSGTLMIPSLVFTNA